MKPHKVAEDTHLQLDVTVGALRGEVIMEFHVLTPRVRLTPDATRTLARALLMAAATAREASGELPAYPTEPA